MKNRVIKGFGIGVFMILLPCFITFFMNGNRKVTEKELIKADTYIICTNNNGQVEKIDTEQYLIGAIAAYLPEDYEDEVYKVMAVILRTYLTQKLGTELEVEESELKLSHLSVAEMEQAWGEKFSENYKRVSQAVNNTSREIITYEEKPIEAYFHDVSAGKTNEKEGAAYLQSVESEVDIDADGYLSLISYTPEEFWKIIESTWGIAWEEETYTAELIQNKISFIPEDSLYIKQVQIGEKIIEAEEFQQAFQLKSLAFFLEEYNGKLRLIIKGVGHGYGVSLYGANAYALEGKNYKWILEKYYTNIVLSHE